MKSAPDRTAIMPMLQMAGITKRFGGVKALDEVSLDLKRHEVLGLIGENGAGKSTLMKVLGGVYPEGSFSGTITIEGKHCRFRSPREAEDAGIAIIHQELELIPQLSISENILLGQEISHWGIIHWGDSAILVKAVMERVGLNGVDPGTLVGGLSLGHQQLVEIAKALATPKKLILFDEPTTSLSESEASRLLVLMKRLATEGTSCIFVSHRLDEIVDVCDRVSVLRDGRNVATVGSENATTTTLISLMIGRQLETLYPPRSESHGDIAFEIKDWTVEDPIRTGSSRLNGVSMIARNGEIVGLGGLVGAGRTELMTSVIGAYPGRKVSGQLLLNGERVEFSDPKAAMGKGVCYLPEDRKRLGLILQDSIAHNLSLASPEAISRWGIIDGQIELNLAIESISQLQIKCHSPTQIVSTLSGGNQQKVVLAKLLRRRPQIIILDEPTRGIDIGARAEIYQLIGDLARLGCCVILISSDLMELIGMSDRVVVICEGSVTAELTGADINERTIMNYCVPTQHRQAA
jgi:ABC-type sugar transport system ATPase subunit